MLPNTSVCPGRAKQPYPVYPSHETIIELEECLATSYGRYVYNGKQIIDLSKAIDKIQSVSLLESCLIEELKLPYKNQYCYWGRQNQFEVEKGIYVDGFYAEYDDDLLWFTLTTVSDDVNRSQKWYQFPEIYLIATAEHSETTKEFLSQQPEEDEHVTPQMYHQIIELALKTAFFISNNKLPEKSWPEDTPAKLLGKTTAGKQKEQAKAISRLESAGYLPMYCVS